MNETGVRMTAFSFRYQIQIICDDDVGEGNEDFHKGNLEYAKKKNMYFHYEKG